MIELPTISLIALLAAVIVSCVSNVNVGLLALSAAWIIGTYVAPQYDVAMGAKGVVAGFPTDLALTLIGVGLLFAQAQINGTLELVAHAGVKVCGGRPALIGPAFFVLTALLAGCGAGNIAAAALVAPAAMLTARRVGVSPLLMAILVGHGSIAGALSPFSPIGIIANKNFTAMGLLDHEWYIFTTNFAANATAGLIGYLLCRGWRNAPTVEVSNDTVVDAEIAFRWQHGVTLAVIGLLLAAVIFGEVHLGLGAFAAALLLILVRASDEREAIRHTPWGVVVMVAGTSTLVSVAERTGGLKLFSQLLAANADAHTANGLLALITGVISIFSSTSGVVLPTFLPMVPEMSANIPDTSPLALATAVNIGSNLVDVSPVSTIGALCLSAMSPADRNGAYRLMLFWGGAMALLAAVISQLGL